MIVTDIRYQPAPLDMRGTGLRGWATATVNGMWVFDSLAVRRTADGRFVLSFPSRRDRSGAEYAYYRPTNAEVRQEIEAAVLEELDRRGFIVLPKTSDRRAP